MQFIEFTKKYRMQYALKADEKKIPEWIIQRGLKDLRIKNINKEFWQDVAELEGKENIIGGVIRGLGYWGEERSPRDLDKIKILGIITRHYDSRSSHADSTAADALVGYAKIGYLHQVMEELKSCDERAAESISRLLRDLSPRYFSREEPTPETAILEYKENYFKAFEIIEGMKTMRSAYRLVRSIPLRDNKDFTHDQHVAFRVRALKNLSEAYGKDFSRVLERDFTGFNHLESWLINQGPFFYEAMDQIAADKDESIYPFMISYAEKKPDSRQVIIDICSKSSSPIALSTRARVELMLEDASIERLVSLSGIKGAFNALSANNPEEGDSALISQVDDRLHDFFQKLADPDRAIRDENPEEYMKSLSSAYRIAVTVLPALNDTNIPLFITQTGHAVKYYAHAKSFYAQGKTLG